MFEQLYQYVMKNEAGYNPNDQGSEAYNGINRGYHPNWVGWIKIDAYKKSGAIKRGKVFPELEEVSKNFYRKYWADMGLKIDSLTNLKVAVLLADMATQHGRWAKIVNAGLYDKNPFDKSIPNKIGAAEYTLINQQPKQSYLKIAEARVSYASNVELKNESDRKGIINRAKKYVADALAYLKDNSGLVTIVGFLFFFFLTDNEKSNGK